MHFYKYVPIIKHVGIYMQIHKWDKVYSALFWSFFIDTLFVDLITYFFNVFRNIK